jgi:hypothetical protein
MMIHRAIRVVVLTSFVSAASAVVALLLWSVTTMPAVGAETERVAVTPARPQRAVSLRDRLVVGLRARLNTEVAFIDAVVMRVNHGLLPQRVVDETFFWARSRASVVRNGRTRRPIIYFQPAMIARAKRLGVEL